MSGHDPRLRHQQMTIVGVGAERMLCSAELSGCRLYRYRLTRIWTGDENGPRMVNFVMLNPSTADDLQDDPTIRRCIRFAKDWGYDGLHVTNLYALRATDPRRLKEVDDPYGIQNSAHLTSVAARAARVVVAWGNRAPMDFSLGVAISLRRISREGVIYCLGITKKGQPVHPLYQPADAVLIPYVNARVP